MMLDPLPKPMLLVARQVIWPLGIEPLNDPPICTSQSRLSVRVPDTNASRVGLAFREFMVPRRITRHDHCIADVSKLIRSDVDYRVTNFKPRMRLMAQLIVDARNVDAVLNSMLGQVL